MILKKTFENYLDNKPTLLFDIDGVLLDFPKSFIEFMLDTTDKKDFDYDNYDFGMDSKELYKHVNDFWASDRFDKIKEIDGAKKGLNELSKYFKIILATAVNEKYKPARIKNLEGFKYDALHFIEHGKIEWVKNNLNINAAVDDKKENLIKLSSFTKTYAPLLKFNTNIPNVTNYNSFSELVELLKKEFNV